MFRRTIICLSLTASCLGHLFAQGTHHTKKKLDNLNSIADTVLLNKKLSALATGSKKDLVLLNQYWHDKARTSGKWDEIARKRFPEEQQAFNQAQNKLLEERDLKKKLIILDSMKKQFPNQRYGHIYASLVDDYNRANDLNQAMAYLNKTDGEDRLMAWSQFALVTDPKALDKVMSIMDQRLLQEKMPKEERLLLYNLKRYLLENKKDYKNAALTAKKAMDLKSIPSQYELDHYSLLLSKSGNYRAAFPTLEKAVYREIGNEEIKNEYKKAFKFIYPDRNADAHLDSIQNSLIEKYEAKYKDNKVEELIKEKAPEFELLDASGNTVSSKEFKDKVLVLDFWATWCMPCKAALPGMQILVDKYKNDPDVKFLFIHSKEIAGESFSKVRDQSLAYFKAHDFSLPLYVDLKTKDTKENKVADSFKVSGIPRKLVIDRNGFIRLSSLGFAGSTLDLVTEMVSVIETVKKLK